MTPSVILFTLSVIEPSTFQLVAHCLHQLNNNLMKIWAFQLEHVKLCKEYSEAAIKGRNLTVPKCQTLHFFKSLLKNAAEINFIFISQHTELNDVTFF